MNEKALQIVWDLYAEGYRLVCTNCDCKIKTVLAGFSDKGVFSDESKCSSCGQETLEYLWNVIAKMQPLQVFLLDDFQPHYNFRLPDIPPNCKDLLVKLFERVSEKRKDWPDSKEVSIGIKWLDNQNPDRYLQVKLRYSWESVDDFKMEFGEDALTVMVDALIKSYEMEKKRNEQTRENGTTKK